MIEIPGSDERYIERGLKCHLWGVDAKDMTREQLLCFIGFLDELATNRALEVREIQRSYDAEALREAVYGLADLLPCPFCGEAPAIDSADPCYAYCGSGEHNFVKLRIQSWNRRREWTPPT